MTMGHNPRTLTSANSIVLFKAAGFFDSPIQLQGFQVDNAFSFGDMAVGETRQGVDAKQSGGWVAGEIQVTVFLEANSPSRTQMEDYCAWMAKNQETSLCELDVTLPSIGKRLNPSGFMVSKSGGPAAQKLLGGTQYVFNMILNGEESIS